MKKPRKSKFKEIYDALSDALTPFIAEGKATMEDVVAALHIMHQKADFQMKSRMVDAAREYTVQEQVKRALNGEKK